MLRIGGFTPLSTTDWPGMLSAVVFCQGCPWRCRYCHNPALIPVHGEDEVGWPSVLAFLRRRKTPLRRAGRGGEPTLQGELREAICEVREMGFQIGLHSAGMYPERLAALLPLLDWVGLDVKAACADYARITGVPGSGEHAFASLDLLLGSGVPYEIRTTVHPALLDDVAASALAHELASLGVRHYAMQAFRSQGCADVALNRSVIRARPLTSTGHDIAQQFEDFAVRN